MQKQFLPLASAFLLAASASAQSLGSSSSSQASAAFPLYDEPYRPQYHFSPPMHFMNDPNGLVYFNGTYHLYYQYNPTQLVAGNQAWGHAVSTDLIHWQNAVPQIAIPEAITGPLAGQIFTGSAVVDSNNTSGFFTGHPGQALVAIYTLNQPTREVQNVAYSLDNGYTYTNYSGNPVLNHGNNPNFRDPKVFYYAPTNTWVMSVALPRAHQVLFYTSLNLKDWTLVSTFGPAGVEGYQWECPNLFPVPVQGTAETKWVLMVGINPGAPQGGSIDQYFVGTFDGTTFTADDTAARVMDFGKDFYAAQTYNNDPLGRTIVVGWMSNWQYTQVVPTTPWRGVYTLPRVLSVLPSQNQTQTGSLLVQTPISLNDLHDQTLFDGSAELGTGASLSVPLKGNSSFEFETTLVAQPTSGQLQQRLNIDISNSAGEKVTVGYDWSQGQVFVNRGQTKGFSNPFFTNKFSVWEANADNSIKLHVFVDRSTLEVFVDNGIQVCSTSFYMLSGPPTNLQFTAENDDVTVQSLTAYSLKSIWR
ncbi:MAG: glycoside hydrolase family 32 protein [Verrucomicrobia bacterium]|nr:glycoside hydrolase family 32 protein [Verrucomicrobiota bacterium]